jgi:hypothetical protein
MPFSIRFGDFYSMNGGSGVKVQSFRLNSLYDPDITGVGGTPTGAAALALIYGSYHIDSVDVKVEFFQYGDDVSQVGFIWHSPGEGPVSTATQIQQIFLEGSQAMYSILPARGSGDSTPHVTLTRHIDLKKVSGRAQGELEDGAFGTNPTDVFALDVCSIDPVGIEAQAILAVVTLKYNGYAFRLLANAYTD